MTQTPPHPTSGTLRVLRMDGTVLTAEWRRPSPASDAPETAPVAAAPLAASAGG